MTDESLNTPNPSYALWRAELKDPVPEAYRHTRTVEPALIVGFWRISAAKTKPSYPVAIWPQDGDGGTVIFFMIGIGAKDGQSMFDTADNPERVTDFLHNGSWYKCSAISQDAYHAAMETGFWVDGQTARQMSQEQKLGVDLTTGGNNPPIEESLADQIAALADKLDKTAEPTSEAQAAALAGDLDRMRYLLDKAEIERKREKDPHWQAGLAVDAKYKAIEKPGDDAYDTGTKRQKAWLKKEQARLDAIAAAETKRRQDEARAEAQRIADEENARRALEAEQLGQVPAETVKPEDIAVSVAPVAAPRATAGTAFGRASGLKKVKVGVITDKAKFIAAISEQPDFVDFLNAKVGKLAKANVLLDGMTIKEELQ